MLPAPSIVEVAAAIIIRSDGSFLLARRPEGKPYAGYWEFPGGKVNPEESLLRALKRELLEELGIHVKHAYPWITRTFTYPHATVRLHFYRVLEWHGEPHPYEDQELSWQFADNVSVEPLLPANAPVLRALDLPPVYGITNAAEWGPQIAAARIEHALQKGLRLVQLREKGMWSKALDSFTREVTALAHHYGARILVNSGTGNASLCHELDMDGIHFTSVDLMNLSKRPDVEWCGASCHNAEELFRAEQLEMDFAVLAPVFPTLSHPDSPALGWRKLARLIHGSAIPVYALGGLRSEDLAIAWEQGAHGIALMRHIEQVRGTGQMA
ncbi:8-oxo-dGTP diphosphatase [Nitrosospira multiformis]|uniref:8-oxo-dGTP diphosphatase n=1 Tax=Nitrosospira multiformis TaxID=1231 RepID=A0A1I0DTG4_9PROT|nr:Nudix family hydrolase [Nitrosospira multiformis]SET35906.1 8-oxo-dGTP diphosphatase [Nitrosospira multiformis]